MRFSLLAFSLLVWVSPVTAAPLSKRLPALLENPPLVCGVTNTAPTARDWLPKDREPRVCGPAEPRNYVPKFSGIGYEILNFESQACFVPDRSFQLLDEIVSKVIEKVKATNAADQDEKVLLISKTTSEALTELGFALWIPTANLSDALTLRRTDADNF